MSETTTRRDVLLKIGAGAGMAWSTPLILSVPAGAATGSPGGSPCTQTLNDPGPPARIEVTVQDNNGLVDILVTKSENADTVVPPFMPGTTDPVVVNSTKIDQSQQARVEMQVTTSDGSVYHCDYTF